MKKKKIIITMFILLPIILIGISYAFFSYLNTGGRTEIITGQIYMNYEETNTISLTNIWPETRVQALSRNDKNGFLEFEITGQNTSENDIYYAIDLLEGGVVSGKNKDSTKILPEHINIYLECDGVILIDGEKFPDWTNRRIYADTIPASTSNIIKKKYTLRIWIDENVTISDTNPNADYTTTEWNDSYASFKVKVYGNFVEKELPVIGYVNYDMSSLGMENPQKTPIYIDKTGIITNEITSTTIDRFIGWSTSIDGDIMYSPGSPIQSTDLTNDNLTLYPILEKLYLEDAIVENMPLTDVQTNGTRYVYGNDVDNNYVWYSGKLWRIVALNSNGTIKLVTQDNIASIAWNTTANNDYANSQVRNWLNNDFLQTIEKNLISTSEWDYTIGTVTDKVGLLTLDDFYITGGADDEELTNTYLHNNHWWLMMTPSTADGDTKNVWRVDGYGGAATRTSTSAYGVRPVVNLNDETQVLGGIGSKSNPYTIKGDILIGKEFEKLSNRMSGEYLLFNGIKYRIIGSEKMNNEKLTKVIMADYSINNNRINESQVFGNNGVFSTTTGIGNYLDNWYKTSIPEDYRKMIATENDGIFWYQGPDNGTGNNYLLTKSGTSISATIGLPYYGEMFSTQFSESYEDAGNLWLMTKYGLNTIWRIDGHSYASYGGATGKQGVRPTFYLKSNVIIKDVNGDGKVGTGFLESPYEIQLSSQ